MHQFSSNVLNQVFNDTLRTAIREDNDRAYVSGNFWLAVNGLACSLQILIMPFILTTTTMPYIILTLPVITFLVSSGSSSLLGVWQGQGGNESSAAGAQAACRGLQRWTGECRHGGAATTSAFISSPSSFPSLSFLSFSNTESSSMSPATTTLLACVSPLGIMKVFEYAVKTSAMERCVASFLPSSVFYTMSLTSDPDWQASPTNPPCHLLLILPCLRFAI